MHVNVILIRKSVIYMSKKMIKIIAFCVLFALFFGDNDATKYTRIDKAGRLFNGELATLGQFPYVVGLKDEYMYKCGGVIISARHVITEAWCIGSYWKTNVTAGCVNFYSKDCVEYPIDSVVTHPNRTPGIFGSNDLAIITVVGAFEMNHLVRSIPIATNFVGVNTNATVVGWSPDLRWAEVQIAEQKDCYEVWAEPGNEMVLCTSPGGISGWGHYGCPLVVDGLLIGFPVNRGNLDIHQRLGGYVDWINSIIYA